MGLRLDVDADLETEGKQDMDDIDPERLNVNDITLIGNVVENSILVTQQHSYTALYKGQDNIPVDIQYGEFYVQANAKVNEFEGETLYSSELATDNTGYVIAPQNPYMDIYMDSEYLLLNVDSGTATYEWSGNMTSIDISSSKFIKYTLELENATTEKIQAQYGNKKDADTMSMPSLVLAIPEIITDPIPSLRYVSQSTLRLLETATEEIIEYVTPYIDEYGEISNKDDATEIRNNIVTILDKLEEDVINEYGIDDEFNYENIIFNIEYIIEEMDYVLNSTRYWGDDFVNAILDNVSALNLLQNDFSLLRITPNARYQPYFTWYVEYIEGACDLNYTYTDVDGEYLCVHNTTGSTHTPHSEGDRVEDNYLESNFDFNRVVFSNLEVLGDEYRQSIEWEFAGALQPGMKVVVETNLVVGSRIAGIDENYQESVNFRYYGLTYGGFTPYLDEDSITRGVSAITDTIDADTDGNTSEWAMTMNQSAP